VTSVHWFAKHCKNIASSNHQTGVFHRVTSRWLRPLQKYKRSKPRNVPNAAVWVDYYQSLHSGYMCCDVNGSMTLLCSGVDPLRLINSAHMLSLWVLKSLFDSRELTLIPHRSLTDSTTTSLTSLPFSWTLHDLFDHLQQQRCSKGIVVKISSHTCRRPLALQVFREWRWTRGSPGSGGVWRRRRTFSLFGDCLHRFSASMWSGASWRPSSHRDCRMIRMTVTGRVKHRQSVLEPDGLEHADL